MKKDKAGYVLDWIAKANSDLKIARREMTAEDPSSDAVCFHFQQGVEKLLKSWLTWRDIHPPRTHNIEILLVACEKLDPTFVELRPVESLTVYAVEIRYPDEIYFPTREEMQEAAGQAALVEAFLQERFHSEGLDTHSSGH